MSIKTILRLFNELPEDKKKEVLAWKFNIGERGWMVYFTCIKEPKSIHQMSRELGYTKKSSISALYHKYQGIPLLDWMVKNGIMKIDRKEGKMLFYQSVSKE